MTFREAIELFRPIYQRFEKLQNRPWGVEGAMIELSKQVGELAKLVMVTEGYYFAQRNQLPQYQASRSLIGDELADIFAQLIRIADYYQVDLMEAHLRARQAEIESLDAMGA
jgi:NTP pyrophosphatase (non-canonical NTP hydrolase)